MLAEDIPDIDFQFSQIWLSSFVNDIHKTVGINYKKILCVYRGYNLKFYFGKKDSDVFAKHALRLMLEKPGFGAKVNTQIRVHSARLKKVSQQITPDFLKKLPHKEFARFYTFLDDVHTELYTWGWLGNAVDMFHGNFTQYLKSVLAQKLSPDEINPVMVTLTANREKTIIQQEHESFLRLVILKKKGSPAQFAKALQRHCDRYFYLKHLWINKEGVYDLAHYRNEVKNFLASKEDPEKVLRNEAQYLKRILRERTRLLKDLALIKREVNAFNIYSELAVTKIIRRDAQIYWACTMDFIFTELAKRLKIPFMHTRFMLPSEVTTSLDNGRIDPALKKVLKARVRYCVYYAEKGYDALLTGKKAKDFEAEIFEESTEGINELTGHTACLGKVEGIVRVVNSIHEMKKMRDGDILVSIATNPDIVPAMKKAGAIVTEQGGITSHAAIVSRELGIPCLIGTKIATKVFKDGDVVEVDATKGIVRRLS